MASLITYRKKLEELEARRSRLMRSGKIMQSFALNEEIKNVEEMIRRAEAYEEATKSRPIAEIITKEELDQTGIIPLMIECHLISDMLVEVAYMIVDRLKEIGIEGVSFMEDLNNAIKANEKFATFLTQLKHDENNELYNLLTRNETLNRAIHKKYVSYMDQRLTKRAGGVVK